MPRSRPVSKGIEPVPHNRLHYCHSVSLFLVLFLMGSPAVPVVSKLSRKKKSSNAIHFSITVDKLEPSIIEIQIDNEVIGFDCAFLCDQR